MQSGPQTRLFGYSILTLAILVQIQTTVQIGGAAIRANAADIAVAALAPIILFALVKNFNQLKEIAGPQLLVLVIAASASLSFSLFRGYEVISGLSTWAAIKYAGWYILLFYLVLGTLIAIVAGPAGKERFALGFIWFQVAIVVAFIAIEYAVQSWSFNEGGKLTGFAGNTNAMAFYLICGFAFALAYLRCTGLSPRRRIAALMAAGILVAGILFTKSIAALVALAFMLLFAVIFHVATLRRLALVLALGGAFWVAPQVSTVTHSPVVNVFDKVSGIVVGASSADPKIRDAGRYESTVGVRMEGYREAFGMWKEHPVFGAGLGVHLHRQSLEGKPEKYILQIHNTALWLLAETGLAGFFVMAGIFVALLHKVWSISRTPPGRPDTGFWFETGVLLILVGWAVMSLFHEIMYQRIVWLLVGMALRSPVKGLSFWKKIPATYR